MIFIHFDNDTFTTQKIDQLSVLCVRWLTQPCALLKCKFQGCSHTSYIHPTEKATKLHPKMGIFEKDIFNRREIFAAKYNFAMVYDS